MIIFKKLWRFITSDIKTFLVTIFIISGIIFLLNLIIAIFWYTNYFGKQVQEKLGIYIYIKDASEFSGTNLNKERPLAKAFKLKDELEKNGLKVNFFSKEEALKRMEILTPGLTNAFKKFNIGNPLMDTLYIVVKDKNQYEIANKIILKYKDIIFDVGDVWKGKDFQSQKKRIQKILQLINFSNKVFVFLILVIVLIISVILLFVIKINFYMFLPQIEVDKLLGASYFMIQMPFILKNIVILFLSFVLTGFYYLVILFNIESIIKDIADISLTSLIFGNINIILLTVLAQFVLLSLFSTIISYFNLKNLIKNI